MTVAVCDLLMARLAFGLSLSSLMTGLPPLLRTSGDALRESRLNGNDGLEGPHQARKLPFARYSPLCPNFRTAGKNKATYNTNPRNGQSCLRWHAIDNARVCRPLESSVLNAGWYNTLPPPAAFRHHSFSVPRLVFRLAAAPGRPAAERGRGRGRPDRWSGRVRCAAGRGGRPARSRSRSAPPSRR